MNKSKILYIIMPIIIALTVFIGFVAINKHIGKKSNETEYKQYDGQTVRLVIGPRLVSLRRPPIIADNEIALDIDTVRRYIDNTVYWDEANGKVTVTTRNWLVRMNTDSLTAFVNDRQEVRLELPVFENDGVVYLPLKFLSEYFQIRVAYDKGNNVVIVDDRREIIQTATVVENGAVIRLGRSEKEPIVKRFAAAGTSHESASQSGSAQSGPERQSADTGGADTGGADTDSAAPESADTDGAAPESADTDSTAPEDDPLNDGYESLSDIEGANFDMYVFEEYNDWYRVRSLDGIVGYIEKKFVAVRRYVDRYALAADRAYAWKPDNGKIVMVWEQVSSARANPDTGQLPIMPGLDVVSPTWFSLIDSGGGIESRASSQYIEWAHARGYKVWALFSNQMNNIEMTSEFLNDSLSRENAIRALLAYTAILGVDGINLDFENVYLEDRDALTQFVRELAPMLREQGITFSVDVNIPDGSDTWSKCYDTPSIAGAADYVNLMAYDQFGAKGPGSGSVSQLSWVEQNLKKLIERDGVPPEKILLGIPFYTRIWEMQSANAQQGDQPRDSSAVGMKTAIGNVLDNSGDVEWDPVSGQFFCKYTKGGKTYHVWLEDPNSVNMRTSLVHKYALAGVSAWSRNFVIPEIWDVLDYNLKEITTYYQWKDEAFIEEPSLVRVR